MEPEIIVKGRGEARSMPDRAVIQVGVDAEGASRELAYNEAAVATKQVDGVISSRSNALDRVSTATLVVHPKTRWKKGESVRAGWRASRTLVLEVTDFEQLGDLIAELAGAGASITGPYWQLDATNAAHGEARTLAAEDARRRAFDYASALGLKVGGVAWISEPGLRISGDQEHGVRAFAAAAPAGARGGLAEEVIEVRPEEIPTVAAVEVGFWLGPLDPAHYT
jgi:uncharacterized protein YggE